MLETTDFGNPWRKVYEWKMSRAWFGAAGLSMLATATLPVATRFGAASTILCASLAMYRAGQAWKRDQEQVRIKTAGQLEFITIAELLKHTLPIFKDKQAVWLGKGFQWTDIEASRMHSLIGQGIAQQFGKEALQDKGAYWLHGLAKEEDALCALDNLVGHTLVTGTTRVGKAQPLDSKVHTPAGWATMGDIMPGMRVSTPDGSSAEVLEVFPQGVLDLYRLTIAGRPRVRACGEHLWRVEYCLEERTCDEELTTLQIKRLLQAHPGLNVYLPISGPVEKPAQKLRVAAYDYGRSVGLCIQLGAPTKDISPCYREGSITDRTAFLRGVLANCGPRAVGTGLLIAMPAGLLRDQLSELVWSLGGVTGVADGLLIEFPDYQPFVADTMLLASLPRAAGKDWCPVHRPRIERIETDTPAEAKCILIDHPEHLYLTDGYVVTHNTRLFDLLIAQAIARGEPVFIIDPKGDQGLADNARKVCEALGQPDRFVYFHPAHPEKSAAIDPLRNWNRKTELASRIAALIPSETGADPFTAFGWKVINDIVNGLIATGQRPNLVKLRRYIEGGPDDLLLKALRLHFKANVRDWEGRVSGYIKQLKDHLLAYIKFYKDIVVHESPAPELEGLISSFEHNRDHFQKMVASLIPILSMLTSGPLEQLLSPDMDAMDDHPVMDASRAVRDNKVVYIGLDSLADSTVGSAIGSVFLADLAAVSGDRYNYGIDHIKPINLFVDEAAEVINQPTIQIMNKGGGAGFRVTIATQTFADFASRLGDENKARQVLANTNNKITLRVLDAETQKYIADGIPKIKVREMGVSYGHNVDANVNDDYTASYKEQSTSVEADLIPPAMFSELPPLHYFARLSGGKTIKGRLPILTAA